MLAPNHMQLQFLYWPQFEGKIWNGLRPIFRPLAVAVAIRMNREMVLVRMEEVHTAPALIEPEKPVRLVSD